MAISPCSSSPSSPSRSVDLISVDEKPIPRHRGLLKKKGAGIFATYAEREFALEGSRLSYYKGREQKGIIDISGAKVVSVNSPQYGFILSGPFTSRQYELMASSESERMTWLRALHDGANYDAKPLTISPRRGSDISLCAILLAAESSDICCMCGLNVEGRKKIALDRIWHIECFKCSYCNQVFIGPYVRKGDKAYHGQCWQTASLDASISSSISGSCPKCGTTAAGDNNRVAMGSVWHQACFCCVLCSKPIKGEFVSHEGKPAHEECCKI